MTRATLASALSSLEHPKLAHKCGEVAVPVCDDLRNQAECGCLLSAVGA